MTDMDDDFAEFVEPLEPLPTEQFRSDVEQEEIPKFVNPNLFLMTTIFTLSILHVYSNQWINFVSLQQSIFEFLTTYSSIKCHLPKPVDALHTSSKGG